MLLGNMNGLRMVAGIDPSQLSVYHFLHIDNLASVFASGFLYSDGYIRDHGMSSVCVAMNRLKERRLAIEIPLFDDLKVGYCVPFYFCTKSVMFYVIFKADSPDLAYKGGQEPIVYLRFDFNSVWEWAMRLNLRRVLTSGNASAAHAEAYLEKDAVCGLDWDAIRETQWGGDDLIQHRKAAELLVEERVSAGLIAEIGVIGEPRRQQAEGIVSQYPQFSQIPINVRREWYF